MIIFSWLGAKLITEAAFLCGIALVPHVIRKAINWREEIEKPIETYESIKIRYTL